MTFLVILVYAGSMERTELIFGYFELSISGSSGNMRICKRAMIYEKFVGKNHEIKYLPRYSFL